MNSGFHLVSLNLLAVTTDEIKSFTEPAELMKVCRHHKLIDFTDVSKAVQTAIGSKQYGYDQLLSKLVVDASVDIMPSNPKNFNVDNVRVVKIFGGSVHDTKVVRGMVFGREPDSKNCSFYSHLI